MNEMAFYFEHRGQKYDQSVYAINPITDRAVKRSSFNMRQMLQTHHLEIDSMGAPRCISGALPDEKGRAINPLTRHRVQQASLTHLRLLADGWVLTPNGGTYERLTPAPAPQAPAAPAPQAEKPAPQAEKTAPQAEKVDHLAAFLTLPCEELQALITQIRLMG